MVGAVVALSGCGGASAGGGATTAGSRSITVYSGQHEQTMSKLVADFEQDIKDYARV